MEKISISIPYSPTGKELDTVNLFKEQRDDAKLYFENCIKPRLDRSYKLYMSDNSDRAAELKSKGMTWKANVSVPYIHSVVETLKPRILDARPEFSVQGRRSDDQESAYKVQYMNDYTWEISKADISNELVVSSSLIYGMGFMQASWKKDVRNLKFLSTKKLDKGRYEWSKKTKVYYDAPFVEWVDNYSLWYDWHNVNEEDKQFWFKRLVLPESVIKRRYNYVNQKKLEIALSNAAGDPVDYGAIRQEIKLAHEKITKGSDYLSSGYSSNVYQDSKVKLHEVFEWYRPFDDEYGVFVNDVPILKGITIPFPYDFKESPFIGTPYLKLPGEYEGYGLPMILENPQIMLNMIKNQRLDSATLNIHKMWIVNPLANIKKEDLVVRPFGIVYSVDPSGAREISMSDIKPSAYRETDELKSDMRYASGVDDFSMGGGGNAGSATEVRHLRESTLERVRLFVNHLGDSYSKLMRFWISMYRQFMTKEMVIRISGDNGELKFPIIEKDDLMGNFDYRATVIPSIAGSNDVKKKQDMDLFQLLLELPFIDPEKLVSKIMHDFNWNINSIKKVEEQAPNPALMGGSPADMIGAPPVGGGIVSEDVASKALSMLGGGQSGESFMGEGGKQSLMAEMGAPINLLGTQGEIPPTPRGVKQTTNPRGMNRKPGGAVNTNLPLKNTASPEGNLLNRARNIQK